MMIILAIFGVGILLVLEEGQMGGFKGNSVVLNQMEPMDNHINTTGVFRYSSQECMIHDQFHVHVL